MPSRYRAAIRNVRDPAKAAKVRRLTQHILDTDPCMQEAERLTRRAFQDELLFGDPARIPAAIGWFLLWVKTGASHEHV